MCMFINTLMATENCVGTEVIKEVQRPSGTLLTFRSVKDYPYSMLRFTGEEAIVENLDSNLSVVEEAIIEGVSYNGLTVFDINRDGRDDIVNEYEIFLQNADGTFTRRTNESGSAGNLSFTSDYDFDGTPDQLTRKTYNQSAGATELQFIEWHEDNFVRDTIVVPTPSPRSELVGSAKRFGPFDSVYFFIQDGWSIDVPDSPDSLLLLSENEVVLKQELFSDDDNARFQVLRPIGSRDFPLTLVFTRPDTLLLGTYGSSDQKIHFKPMLVKDFLYYYIEETPSYFETASHMLKLRTYYNNPGNGFLNIDKEEVFRSCSFNQISWRFAYLGTDSLIMASSVGKTTYFYKYANKSSAVVDKVTVNKLSADSENYRFSVEFESHESALIQFISNSVPVVAISNFAKKSISPVRTYTSDNLIGFEFHISGVAGSEVTVTIPTGHLEDGRRFPGAIAFTSFPVRALSCEDNFPVDEAFSFEASKEIYEGADSFRDFNNDGLLDILSNNNADSKSLTGSFIAINTGTSDQLWDKHHLYDYSHRRYDIELVDFNEDGNPEVFEPRRGRIYPTLSDYLAENNFRELDSEDEFYMAFARKVFYADLNLDGKAEFWQMQSSGTFYDFTYTQDTFTSRPGVSNAWYLFSKDKLSRHDFNQNGIQDFVVDRDGILYVHEAGIDLEPRSTVLSYNVVSHCMVDINGDGIKEILSLEEEEDGELLNQLLYVHSGDLQFERRLLVSGSPLLSVGPAADFDGDGFEDVIIRFNGYGSIAYGAGTYDNLNYSAAEFPVLTGTRYSHFMQGDVDNDGDIDIIAQEGYAGLDLVTIFNCSFTPAPTSVPNNTKKQESHELHGNILVSSGDAPIGSVQVYSAQGNLVFNGAIAGNTFDLSSVLFASGMYFLKHDSGVTMFTLIK